MKKDTEKHPLVSQTTTSVEPIKSSSLITLQLLNKAIEKTQETEKKEADEEAARVYCKTCHKEIYPKRLCPGHGAGNSGGAASADADLSSDDEERPEEDNFFSELSKSAGTKYEISGEFDSEEIDLELSIDPKIIEGLIANGLLLIENDRESLTLSIKLLCEPDSLTKEQRKELKKFMESIIKEFNEFKDEHKLSNDCMSIIKDNTGNIISLRITMPTLALYDDFIQRLTNNLVPVPGPKAKERNELTNDQRKDPNPFSMEPSPYTTAKEKVEDTEINESREQEFNPSPFKMTPW